MGLVSQHPHIVTVFNAAFTTTSSRDRDGAVQRRTMGERQKREGDPRRVVLDAGVKIAGALETAQTAGCAPRHQAAEPVHLRVRRAGARRLRDLDARRRAVDLRRRRAHRPLPPARGLRGGAGDADLGRLLVRRHAYTLLEGGRPFARPRGSRQPIGELARRIMLEEPPRVPKHDAAAGSAPSCSPARWQGGRNSARGRRPSRPGVQRIRGVGLPVTALPLATPAAGRPQPMPVSRQGPAATPAVDVPLPPPEPIEPHDVGVDRHGHDDDDAHTATVGRTRRPRVTRRRAASPTPRRGASCSARSPASAACSPWPCRCCVRAGGRRRLDTAAGADDDAAARGDAPDTAGRHGPDHRAGHRRRRLAGRRRGRRRHPLPGPPADHPTPLRRTPTSSRSRSATSPRATARASLSSPSPPTAARPTNPPACLSSPRVRGGRNPARPHSDGPKHSDGRERGWSGRGRPPAEGRPPTRDPPSRASFERARPLARQDVGALGDGGRFVGAIVGPDSDAPDDVAAAGRLDGWPSPTAPRRSPAGGSGSTAPMLGPSARPARSP